MLDRSEWLRLLLFLALTALTSHSTAAGENWPDFRGPTMDGRSDATQLPLTWSETEKFAGKRHCPAWGTPPP